MDVFERARVAVKPMSERKSYSIDPIGRGRRFEARARSAHSPFLLAHTQSAVRVSAPVSLAVSSSLQEVSNA